MSFQDISAVAIGAFDPAGVFGDLQPDARMAQCTFAAITGDTRGFDDLGFRRFDCHGWRSFTGCRPRGHAVGAFMSDEQTGGKSHMTDAAIRIEGLRKTYRGSKGQPEKQALKGIDLTIPRGSVFGLLGPNGAGKSTLINILAGLVVKSAGHVSIWGYDQDKNPRQSRAAIGVMPQELNLDPFFTPRGALEVQAGLYGVPRAQRRSDEILELVGLSDKAEAYARTLSGGMRRRLLLAKALVHHPKVLVLDEPTAGVDIELRQMLWANVRKLNEQGMTIILTTHYLEEAQEMCDQIAIINHGEKIAQDSTANLLGRMDGRTMVIIPDGPVSDLPATDGVEAALRDDGSLVLRYRSAQTSAEQVLESVRAVGIRIRDVRTEEADLEDVFLALTSSRAVSSPADDQDQPGRGLHRVKL